MMSERFDPVAVVEEFEALTKDAGRTQRETLKKILEENCETEYLQKWGLNGSTDPDSFAATVPLVTHHDLEPYILRVAQGAQNSSILTAKPIPALSVTSGTTRGKPKYVPFNDTLAWSTMQFLKIAFAYRHREYPLDKGRNLTFIYCTKPFETKGGLPVATFSSNLTHSEQFRISTQAMQDPQCSPIEVMFGPDYHESLYCHLLCGLIFRNQVQVVSSPFSHNIVQAFRAFEQLWEELVANIQEGTLSSRITAPPIRSAMSKLLKPDPELATIIRKVCLELVDSNWYGLIHNLFPNAKYVQGCMTGSMQPCVLKLRHYAGGGLPLMAGDYGSSETCIGVNVNPKLPPELTTFAVLPHISYFEFIPLGKDLDVDSRPVGLTEVQDGEEYEIVITNFAGLYRYRLGDTVKVRGFHNSTPKLQFVCRRNVLLSVNTDKTTENELQIAVEGAVKLLAEEKLEVVDFTSRVDTSKDPGHYVIIWEISGKPQNEILKACCNCLDSSFVDLGYILSRRSDAIGPLELCIVKTGTFHKLMDHYVGQGASISQFKTPRCIGSDNNTVLQLLSSNVVDRYFSTVLP